MGDGTVAVTEGAGKLIDNEELTVNAKVVERQRVRIAGAGAAELADVRGAAPAGTDNGVVTRNIPSGTQGVSAAALPLPAGASTEATLALIKAKTDNLDVALSTRTKPSDTQPVSAASLPLPTGAATEATLGTRAADATLTGGTAKAIARGGAKGATAAADLTSTAQGADHQALDVQLMHGGTAKDPTATRALTAADVVTANQGGAPWTVNPSAETAGVGVGAAADAEAAGNGSIIALLKRLRTLLAAGLPAALAASGGLKVDLAGTGGNATAVKVDGSAVTQPVSAAGLTNLDVALSTRLKPADTLAAVTTVGAVTAITNALPTGGNKLGQVDIATAAATAKGTQGANGVPVQELKDSGRVNIMWTLEFAPAAIAEALMTMTESRDGAAVTTFTTKVITAGKRLRMSSWTMTVENTLGANPKRAKLRMKFNAAGAVTTASPLQANLVASVAGVVNTVGTAAFADFPDGIEFAGDGTKQIGFTLEFPDWVTAAQTGKVYVTIFGFEY